MIQSEKIKATLFSIQMSEYYSTNKNKLKNTKMKHQSFLQRSNLLTENQQKNWRSRKIFLTWLGLREREKEVIDAVTEAMVGEKNGSQEKGNGENERKGGGGEHEVCVQLHYVVKPRGSENL